MWIVGVRKGVTLLTEGGRAQTQYIAPKSRVSSSLATVPPITCVTYSVPLGSLIVVWQSYISLLQHHINALLAYLDYVRWVACESSVIEQLKIPALFCQVTEWVPAPRALFYGSRTFHFVAFDQSCRKFHFVAFNLSRTATPTITRR